MINMDINKAIEILDNHNKWRRDSEGVYKMAEPKELGIAIDTVVSEFRNSVDLGDVVCSCCGCLGLECEHPFYAVNSKCNGEINLCTKCGENI